MGGSDSLDHVLELSEHILVGFLFPPATSLTYRVRTLAKLSKRVVTMFKRLHGTISTSNSNICMAKDGVVLTPTPNGTFLAGITRQRVIGLLCSAGVKVVETTLTYQDFEKADEIVATGN